MHSLETIKRLNNQSQDNWTANQDQERYKLTAKIESQDQSFLVFSINQALGLVRSNSEVSVLLKAALGMVEKPEKI